MYTPTKEAKPSTKDKENGSESKLSKQDQTAHKEKSNEDEIWVLLENFSANGTWISHKEEK